MATALLHIMALGSVFDYPDYGASPTSYQIPFIHGTQINDDTPPWTDAEWRAVPGQPYLDIYGWSWGPEMSSNGKQNANRQALSIAYDSDQNVIVTGWYSACISYASCPTISPIPTGAGTFRNGACCAQGTTYGTSGNKHPSDIFVAKIAGNQIKAQTPASIADVGTLDMAIEQPNAELMWLYSFGGDDADAPSSEDAGHSVITIGTNIYVAGCYTGLGTFGAITKTSTNANDAFVMKLSSAGTVEWVQSGGSAGSKALNGECALALAVDSTDPAFIYVAGYSEGVFSFGGAVLQGKVNAMNAFVAKMRVLDGTAVWLKGFAGEEDSGNADDSHKAYARGISAHDNNIYVTGDFSGEIQELGGAGILKPAAVGHFDVFLIQMDYTGAVLKLKTYSGDSQVVPQTSESKGTALAIHPSTKNVFLVGSFQGVLTVPVNLVPQTFTGNKGTLVSGVGDDWADTPFVIALDETLNAQWVKIVASPGVDNPIYGMLGSTAPGVAVGTSCALDLFVTGSVSGPTADFGTLAAAQASGMYLWQMTTATGSPSNYYVYEANTDFYSYG